MNPASTPYRLVVLGDLRLESADGAVLRRRRKELAFLAWIALRAGPVRREEAAAAFWGETDDAHARQSLRQAVASIRKVAPAVLEIDGDAMTVAAGTLTVDLRELDAYAAAGDRASALGMWRGELLPGAEDFGAEPFRTWLEAERSRLRTRLAGFLQRLAGDATTPAEQLRWAERWTEIFPLDERAHLHLLGALERGGRIGEALERHAGFAARYRAEREGELPAAVRETVALLQQREAGSTSHRPGSAAFFTPDLTGRDAELAALDSAWKAASGRGGVVVLIEGEAGAGRTRLCGELARSVAGQGRAIVLQAPRQCEGEAVSPLSRFLAPLAAAPGLAAAAPASLAALSCVLPELVGKWNLPPAGDGADLAAATLDAVAAVADELPVLIVADDAPDICTELRSVLAHIAARVPRHVLLVLTSEPGRLTGTDLGRAFREASDGRRLKLQPLDENQIEVLIASMVPLAAADRQRLASMLLAETDGNPLRITDCISAFADAGVLAMDANGLWRLSKGRGPASLPLPPSLVRIRIERLTTEARRTLEAAASRSRIDARTAAASARLDEQEVQAALGELVSRRLMRPIPESPFYEITSDIVRAEVRPAATPIAAPKRGGWRRRLATAGLAAIGLALAGLAARSALPASVAVEPDRVIVFPFESLTRSDDVDGTGRAAAEAVIQAIGRSGAAAAVPIVPPDLPDSPERVREVASASGAALAVLGTWHRVADTLVLEARLVDVGTGEVRTAARDARGSVSRRDEAVRALSASVVGAIAARLDHRIAAAARAGSIPPTYEAYQAFAQGLDFLYAREGERANPAFYAAYHRDTSYVLPLIYAAFSHLGQGRLAVVDSLVGELEARRSLLTPYEQATVDFLRYETGVDLAARYTAARRAAELAPGSMMAGYYLPRAAIGLNRPREAIAALDAVDPDRDEIAGMPGYWSMLSMALHMAGAYERQLEIGRTVEARLPRDTRGLHYQVRAFAALGRIDSLDAVLRRSFSVSPVPGWDAPGLSLHLLAFDELTAHGFRHAAVPLLARAVALYERAPDSLRGVPRQRLEMARALYRLARYSGAGALTSGLIEDESLGWEVRIASHQLHGLIAAATGDTAGAEREERWLAGAGRRYAFGRHTEARAHIAARLGRHGEAVRLLHQAVTEGRGHDNNTHLHPDLLALRGNPAFEEWFRPKP
ncbi:MAG: AAA family ATPase [Gemmatimonadota bacterium]